HLLFFVSPIPLPPTSTLFPYTTLFRSSTLLDRCICQQVWKKPPRIPSLLDEARPTDQVEDERGHLQHRRRSSITQPATTQHAERSEEHTSELQSHLNLVCRLLLEKKKK